MWRNRSLDSLMVTCWLNRSEERILLAEDRDFGELIFRERKSAYGVILLRIPPAERSKKSQRITTLVPQ